MEDDDATALLVSVALSDTNTELEYIRVADVDAAVALLSTDEARAGTTLPSLVLLDLNLPRRSGFDLLTLIRSTNHLKSLRVAIFTASSAPSDRQRAVTLGADDYLSQPSAYDEYVEQLGSLVKSL